MLYKDDQLIEKKKTNNNNQDIYILQSWSAACDEMGYRLADHSAVESSDDDASNDEGLPAETRDEWTTTAAVALRVRKELGGAEGEGVEGWGSWRSQTEGWGSWRSWGCPWKTTEHQFQGDLPHFLGKRKVKFRKLSFQSSCSWHVNKCRFHQGQVARHTACWPDLQPVGLFSRPNLTSGKKFQQVPQCCKSEEGTNTHTQVLPSFLEPNTLWWFEPNILEVRVRLLLKMHQYWQDYSIWKATDKVLLSFWRSAVGLGH